MSVDGVRGMAVPPHPHIGLQTVTWLFAGNVLHRDSLGSEQMIRPGQLNLMTAGRGISHSEESPAEHDPLLHGVQLWVALPDRSRFVEPGFEHHGDLPAGRIGDLAVTVLIGSLAGLRSPATAFTGIVGAELAAPRDAAERVTIQPSFEHALLLTTGSARVADTDLAPGSLLYLPPGRDEVAITAREGAVLMLLGGIPLGERLLMWWNFVARTPDEIASAVEGWREGTFGRVRGYAGRPLDPPPLDVSRLISRT
jgi:redox-sensitive bicupin YhaK (pirin superfamily)